MLVYNIIVLFFCDIWFKVFMVLNLIGMYLLGYGC